jgi:hypothetical protein
MREVTIKLGERTFVVPQLTIRNEAKWRRTAEEAMGPFFDAAGLMNIDIAQSGDLRQVVAKVGAILNPMAAIDALCAYAPEIAAAREWIEDNCYSDEVFGALVALFFGQQLRQLERMPQIMNGALAQPGATT